MATSQPQPETNVLFVTRNHANVSAASSDDASNLEETSQIVDLTEWHGEENECLEEWPQHHPRVSVIIDWTKQHLKQSKSELYKQVI